MIFWFNHSKQTIPTLPATYQSLCDNLATMGFKPELHILDNKASSDLKKKLKKEKVDFQLVLPQVHHLNAAEGSIQTFKNHFVSGLFSVNQDFPMHLWDRLLPQAEITLNLV